MTICAVYQVTSDHRKHHRQVVSTFIYGGSLSNLQTPFPTRRKFIRTLWKFLRKSGSWVSVKSSGRLNFPFREASLSVPIFWYHSNWRVQFQAPLTITIMETWSQFPLNLGFFHSAAILSWPVQLFSVSEPCRRRKTHIR